MNKGRGATTIGAILLAGFMFQARPGIAPSTGQPESSTTQITAQSLTKPVTGEGPWKASCKYWSAALAADSPDHASPDLDVTLHQTGNTVESHIKTSITSETACGPDGDGWGIPKISDTSDHSHDPEISAIVATIPDPIHSHLALDFDRSVDAILLAAADNRYLSSYYWLPWRSHVNSSANSEPASASATKDEDNTRERQPGLIILRYAPDAADWQKDRVRFSRAHYHRVIYLFLVGETPALGVNGTQLQNAFRYEKTLKKDHHTTLSMRPWPFADQASTESRISIIGPFFSGSASSLREGIEVAQRELNMSQISISGITGTPVAAHELDPNDEHIYRSFGENAAFEQVRFLKSLAATGYDLSRVAVLSEAGTVFGKATGKATSDKPTEDTKPLDETADTKTPCPTGAKDRCEHIDITDEGTVLYLRFPRELSLLRNAQTNQSAKSDASAAPPTPYLNLSLKDYTADDTVPRLSTTQSPLSIEAQLMAIAHQLQRARIEFILISASNVLDDIFLAQFLHRACPNAQRVVFSGGDLLFERDVDNAPYVGSISISPYLLTSLDFGKQVQWLYPDYQAEAIYNAASYTFWDRTIDPWPTLAGYRRYPVPNPIPPKSYVPPDIQFMQVPLWATVLGTDGYYPLAILDWCGSNLDAILPTIQPDKPPALPTNTKCKEQQTTTLDTTAASTTNVQHVWDYVPESINRNSGIAPSLLWSILDIFIILLCLLHSAMLVGAQYWSPFTRDLAIHQNDQPHRRSVHLNIGTSVLAGMAFVVAYPMLRVGHFYHITFLGYFLAGFTIFAALLACFSTIVKTIPYLFDQRSIEYRVFNLVAGLALLVITVFWVWICGSDSPGAGSHSYVGLFFSYRCLQPFSGVCPLLPVLLLLFAWYLWAICQTARLRFSDMNRPRIALSVPTDSSLPPTSTPYPLFVSDDALEDCSTPISSCLYKNITCLLITREVLSRFIANLKNHPRKVVNPFAALFQKNINYVLAVSYLFLFALCIFATHIHGLDRFLFTPILAPIFCAIVTSIAPRIGMHYGPTPYEFLITALFFPLIMVALSGWLRTILIWGALSRGLLEPLERLPIRFAFTRLKGGSWISMIRQSGLQIRWRDMGRSTEAIRQLVHHPEMLSKSLSLQKQLSMQYAGINDQILKLMARIHPAAAQSPNAPSAAATTTPPLDISDCPPAVFWDLPKAPGAYDLCLIYSIEKRYADFCKTLLESVLVPYWDLQRTGLVEESNSPFDAEAKIAKTEKPEKPEPSEQAFIHLAEEFVVVRYVALIRAVLVNIRYLMIFVSAAFVLALVAWNSYPFQPHAVIDWCFTIMFVLLSIGFIAVFAQMHRNAILSRLTDTKPNELGWEFYLRIVTFGAVPVLTWLAYQFPEIGGSLFRIFQPGLQVMK